MKEKILLASDSPSSPTGFAGQMKFVAKHLQKLGNEVVYLGWQHQLEANYEEDGLKMKVVPGGFPRLPNQEPSMHDLFGRRLYPLYFENEQVDILVTLGDAWMVNQIPHYEYHPLWVMYFPVDGHPLNDDIKQTVEQADIPVAMSKFGQDVCAQHGLNVNYIPHQINYKRLSKFKNKKKKQKLRQKYFSELKEETVLYGSIARMNPRKHHMRLFRAFEKFVRENNLTPDDVRLYLHADPYDVMYNTKLNSHDYFIVEFIDTLDLQDYIIFPPKPYSFAQGVSEEELLERMACIDVHINATGGEGFGVPTLEVMAMGIPNIITDYTTSAELVAHKDIYTRDRVTEPSEQRGILVPFSRLYMEKPKVYKAWVDTDAFADALAIYYFDEEKRILHGENAFKFAKQYDSKNVNKMWTKLFERIPTIKVMQK